MTAERQEIDIKKTMQVVRAVVGGHAQKAMEKYAKRSRLGPQQKAHDIIESTSKV